MDQSKEDLAQELSDVLAENAIFSEHPHYEEWEDAELSIFEKDGYGFTILMIAAENNHLPVVKFLVSKSVDINAVYNRKKTALDFAHAFANPEVVTLLEEAGAKRAAEL